MAIVPDVRMREAVPDDAEEVVRIYIESWNKGFGKLMPHREITAAVIAQWRGDLTKPLPQRWWVAEVGDRIAGFVGICPSRDPIDPTLGEVDTIAVDPAYWRAGVGRALMAVALRYLAEDGYRGFILWTLANYERGQRFYEAMGWRLDGGTRRDGTQVRYRWDADNAPAMRMGQRLQATGPRPSI